MGIPSDFEKFILILMFFVFIRSDGYGRYLRVCTSQGDTALSKDNVCRATTDQRHKPNDLFLSRALSLASTEVRFHVDSETNDPIDVKTKELL